MKTFEVMRQHQGDKMYMPGDRREAIAGDVHHLVKSGVLRDVGAKSEPPIANKAEKPVKNKAE